MSEFISDRELTEDEYNYPDTNEFLNKMFHDDMYDADSWAFYMHPCMCVPALHFQRWRWLARFCSWRYKIKARLK